MTFGDVLSITLIIVTTVVTLWAGIVAFSVIFSTKARTAATALQEKPGRQIGMGFLIFAITTAISLSLISKGGGPLAMIGFAIAAAVLTLAVLGSSGLALVIAVRLRALDPKYSALEATARGAGLAVAVGLIPVIGWFFLFPAAVFASLGAGVTALTTRPEPAHRTEPIAVAATAEL